MISTNCRLYALFFQFGSLQWHGKLTRDAPGADSAGFQFVVNTTDHKSNENKRKSFMNHVAKAQWRRRKPDRLHSWIDPSHRISHAASRVGHPIDINSKIPGPARFGGDFSGTPLPPGVEPAMIQELVKLIDLDKEGVYPYEVCLRVHPAQRGWFPTMIGDICCLHSMMYSVRVFLDMTLCEGQPGQTRLVAFHYDQSLRLLQGRINAYRYGQQVPRFRDPTIMTIIILIAAAEITGDYHTAQIHLDGLLKIVSLAGGLRSLSTENNLPVKVCRADLGVALRVGSPPRLMLDDIKWDSFIADRGLVRCSHSSLGVQISAFVNTLDSRLGNAWKDVHAFSCLSNLAYQTDGKMSPTIYNEMMISILYRLTHLLFEEDVIQEVIRVALLTFCTTLFLTRHYLNQPYERLCEVFETGLLRLCRSASDIVPPPIWLWLVFLHQIVMNRDIPADAWARLRLESYIRSLGVGSWSEAHEVLRSVMWVDFVHDSPGMRAFSTARRHLEDTEEESRKI